MDELGSAHTGFEVPKGQSLGMTDSWKCASGSPERCGPEGQKWGQVTLIPAVGRVSQRKSAPCRALGNT